MKLSVLFAVALSLFSSSSVFAKTDDALKVCGRFYRESSGQVGLADASVNMSYQFVIEASAKLGAYESSALRDLQVGDKACAVGIEGVTLDTYYPTVILRNWALLP